MLEVCFYDKVEDRLLKFAVIIAKAGNKWVYCRHKDRDTFEVPGGHREPGENILDTAKRELYEECGAVEYDIIPICVYCVKGTDQSVVNQEETFGMLYYATITEFGKLPDYEMGEVILLEGIPNKWTYPLIQPKLMSKVTEFIRRT